MDPVAGSTGNTGLSWAQAFKNMDEALGQGDIVRCYIRPGVYSYTQDYGKWRATPINAVAIIAVGGQAIMTPRLQLSYTLVGNHYEAASADTVSLTYDTTGTPQANGDYCKYTLGADAAAVDANPGYWYFAAGVYYVRTWDNRAPDADLHPLRAASNGMLITADNKSYYFENITWRWATNRAVRFYGASAAGGFNVYMKNCYSESYLGAYNAFAVEGVALFYAQDCLARWTAADGFNYNVLNTSSPKFIQIDCQRYW